MGNIILCNNELLVQPKAEYIIGAYSHYRRIFPYNWYADSGGTMNISNKFHSAGVRFSESIFINKTYFPIELKKRCKTEHSQFSFAPFNAGNGTWTHTMLPPQAPEACASANSAIPAFQLYYHITLNGYCQSLFSMQQGNRLKTIIIGSITILSDYPAKSYRYAEL